MSDHDRDLCLSTTEVQELTVTLVVPARGQF
jgi:hypothetical protein